MQGNQGEDRELLARQLPESLNAMQGALGILRVSTEDAPRRHAQEVLERQVAVLVDLCARISSPAGVAAAPAIPEADAPHRVLVVDDNTDSAEVLAALLDALGHDAACAFDGTTALRMVESHRPDVVFLDMALPDMSGFDVARRLRADPRHARLRIIGLTGFGSDEHRRRAAEEGLDDYVVKPVHAEALMALLSASRPAR